MEPPSLWEQQQKHQNIHVYFLWMPYYNLSVTDFYLYPKQHMLYPISIFHFPYELPLLYFFPFIFFIVYFYESINILLTFTSPVVRTVPPTQ